jgi:hypothetical protein
MLQLQNSTTKYFGTNEQDFEEAVQKVVNPAVDGDAETLHNQFGGWKPRKSKRISHRK